MDCTELDLAEDDFFAEFEEKVKELSVIKREKLQVGWGDLKCTYNIYKTSIYCLGASSERSAVELSQQHPVPRQRS